jgi:hypothetical protein
MHREPPLNNHAPEKSGLENPKGPKSCSQIESLGVGFERECAGKPGIFGEPLTVEKKLSASLADRAGFEPAVAVTPRTLSKRVP